MKYVQTFESFHAMNEGKQWFTADSTLDDNIGDSAEWDRFWKNAKKGDTFISAPDGVEVPYIDKSEMGKDEITPRLVYYGHSTGARGETAEDYAKVCTIIDRKKVKHLDSDYDPEEMIDTIFYIIKDDRDPGTVYLLGEI